MIYSLLEGEGGSNAASGYGNWIMLAILAVLIVVVVVSTCSATKNAKSRNRTQKTLSMRSSPAIKLKLSAVFAVLLLKWTTRKTLSFSKRVPSFPAKAL